MKTLAMLLLSVGAAAAPAPAPTAQHAKPYWLKTYSFAPYRESWRSEYAVKNLDEAMPKITAAIEKNGGRLTQPLRNFVRSATDQQLTLTVPQKNSKALLKDLRKLGKGKDPAVRPGGAAIPAEEVREKLARLLKDRENVGALAQASAAAEAVDEIIEHLANAEAVSRSDGEILWNLTVKEAP